MQRAYGQRDRWTAAGQRVQACSSCLRALSERLRIARSAIPFLEMGVHATKCELLAAFLAQLLEGVVRESSVVAVIMQIFYAMFGSKLFERALGPEGLLGGKVEHEMDESEAREVVHKDGGASVSLLGKFPFQLRKETHLR